MTDATSETGTVGSLCFSFLCSALYIIVCLVHFLLAIVLSVLWSIFFWPLYCLSFGLFSFGRCIVCPLVYFLLAIVLSVLRFTASVYTFGIFKLTIFNHRGTEVVKCMLLVILQRTDGLVYHLNSSCTQCWVRDTSDP